MKRNYIKRVATAKRILGTLKNDKHNKEMLHVLRLAKDEELDTLNLVLTEWDNFIHLRPFDLTFIDEFQMIMFGIKMFNKDIFEMTITLIGIAKQRYKEGWAR